MSFQPGTPPTVVVTGASKGIGAAIVRRLVADGFRVIAGVRRPEDAQALRKELGDRVLPALLDITDPDAVAAAVELVGGEAGDRGLAGLVNNAGIAVAAPLEFLLRPSCVASWRSTWSVSTRSPRPWWRCCVAAEAGSSTSAPSGIASWLR